MLHPHNPVHRIAVSFDEVSDESLLRALADGAVWAMEPLYHRYRRYLYALAYQMVRDPQVAENLLQEVFFAVWRRATLYSPQLGTVRTWLISIMRHRAIDYVRSVDYRSTLKEVSWEARDQEIGPAGPEVWEAVWQAIQSAQVRTALLHIPEEQRLVIVLAYFQGWTHKEIAERYQLPLGTVKGRLRLGLVHLKRALEHREEASNLIEARAPSPRITNG